MVEYSDVFDEVDEFQKKAKSEEEIQKMCTKEDMTELQRACLLLKKGWEIQKHSVITNLDRYLKEPGANDDLLRPILSSLDGWDEKLQIICANSFLPALKKNLVHMENKQRILNLSVKITTDELCQNEPLINSWIDVFQTVVGMVDYDYAYMVSYKAIENITDRKNPLPRRLKGDKLLMALALNFGEHCFEEHKDILRKIQNICGDTNFIIRLDGVQFLNQYLLKHKDKIIGSTRFEQVYLVELYEFLHDEEIFIRIEAIEALSHVVDELDIKTVEKELMPALLKMLTLGVHDEIDLRFSKIFGRIVFSLVKSELHLKYKEKLFNYYRQLLDHPKEEIRVNAAYNLPCFNQIYNRRNFNQQKIQLPIQKPNTATTQATRDSNNDEEEKMNFEDDDIENFDFHSQYFTLAQESDENTRALIANCLHEAFNLSNDLQDTSLLRDTLHELLLDESKVVILTLVPNLDRLIGCYCNQHAQNQISAEVTPVTKQDKNSIIEFPKGKGGFGEFSKRQFLLKKQMTMAVPDVERLQVNEEDQAQQQYLILPEYVSEQVYSRLLGKLIEYKQFLQTKIGLWRENVTFLEAIANQVHKFHVPELQDRFVPIIMEEIPRGNTQLRHAASKLFVMILAHQQDSQRKKALADQLRSELGESQAFQLRKTFILICRYGIDKLQRIFFEENFFDTFIELCDDKVAQVRIEFAKSLVQIKPYLEPNKKLSMQLNERIISLNDDLDQDVADAIEDTDYQLLMTRKKLLLQLEESEKRCDLEQQRLNLREIKENEEKKKRQEEDGDNKYDYGTYGQTNRAGMFGGVKSKGTKNTSKKTAVGGSKVAGVKGVATTVPGVEKTKLKRTTTTIGKSSGLPSADSESRPNATRKTSVLLPTFTGNLEGKGSSLTIPGFKEIKGEPPGGLDNYKRYQQMIVTSAGGGNTGQVNGYKRSQSLLAEPSSTNSAANKNRLPKKNLIGGNDSSHQVTAVGSQPATKQKNGYQKLTNQARKGALSSEEDSSDDNTPQSKGKTSSSFKTKY